jgi:hypothetical protein
VSRLVYQFFLLAVVFTETLQSARAQLQFGEPDSKPHVVLLTEATSASAGELVQRRKMVSAPDCKIVIASATIKPALLVFALHDALLRSAPRLRV